MPITPSVQALRLNYTIPVAPGVTYERFVYCFLIFGEKITMIDTGVAGCGTEIFEAIRTAGRDPKEIGLIILTHSHPDHIGGAWAIQRATGCSIAAHPAERAWIEDLDLQNRQRPVPGFESLVSGPVEIEWELDDGECIIPDETEGGLTEMTVIHTPGHSPGSISLFMEATDILFSGDAIPVPGNPPIYDDPVASITSIRRLKELEEIAILFSAWDQPVEGMEIYHQLDRALEYIQTIHAAVTAASADGHTDLVELTQIVAASAGISQQMIGPLLTRTVSAHLHVQEIHNLLK